MITNKDKASWLKQTLDIYSEEIFGEFGYNTLNDKQQLQVLIEVIADGLLNNMNDE